MMSKHLIRLSGLVLAVYAVASICWRSQNPISADGAIMSVVLILLLLLAFRETKNWRSEARERRTRSRDRAALKFASVASAAADARLLGRLAQIQAGYKLSPRAAAQRALYYQLYLTTLIAIWNEFGRHPRILYNTPLGDLHVILNDRKFADEVLQRYSIARSRLRAALTADELAEAASTLEPLDEQLYGAFLREFSTEMLESILEKTASDNPFTGTPAIQTEDEEEWADVIHER